MELFLTYLAKGLVMPPAGNLVLLLMARVLRRWRWVSRLLVFVAIASLYVLSAPFGAGWLAAGLERQSPPFDLANPAAASIEAIVVPGTGRYTVPPEYDSDQVSNRTLERLRYAARVHRVTKWPIAVVGGSPLDELTPEGVMMAESLQTDFNVPVEWVEAESDNTQENARNARELVGADTILLVTQATDMPRAKQSFASAGFTVVPAPIGFATREADGVISIFDFVPNTLALGISQIALHEWLGIVWYRFRYGH